jgi:hypothetical protein
MKRWVMWTVVMSILLIGMVPVPKVLAEVLFSDDFESYPVGTFPGSGGWTLVYNGAGTSQQVIDNSKSVSGTKAFHLAGGSGCWAATASRNVTISENVSFELFVFVEKMVNCGCSTYMAELGLGQDYGKVVFDCDGNIYSRANGGNVFLRSYAAGSWYRVKIVCDFSSQSFDVYIDGVKCGSDIKTGQSALPANVYISAEHGANPVAWFDDLRVFTGNGTVDGGETVASDLWLKTVLKTSAGWFTLKWKEVGSDTTPSGAEVLSGYFYADPADFEYGSEYNPEVFVKIYIDPSGWCNIAFNHVTVDEVAVYSAHHYAGVSQKSGVVTLTDRLVEHQYDGVAIQNTAQGNGKIAPNSTDGGYALTSGLWGKAVLQPSIGPVTLIWKEVGTDFTPSGDKVVSGYFYADPGDFAYGSEFNPEVFVKIYIAKNGWCNIAFNHVTVDDVGISSAHHYAGTASLSGTASLTSRLLEHQYSGVELGNDHDTDGDGYTENQGDCNDSDAAVHPGAAEICGDGIDQDCNGSDVACETADEATVVIGTDTWATGTVQNVIWLKRASSYALADLQGAWATHELASAPGAPYWERGTVTIQSNGSFSVVVTDSEGGSGPAAGKFQIASDGAITWNGVSNFKGNLDADKTVAVSTETWDSGDPGTSEMKVWVKQVPPYSLSDLVGSWAVHGLASGASWWIRGTLEIQSNGAYQASLSEYDGKINPPETESGTLRITPDGTITRDGDGKFKCSINKGN